MKSAKKIKFKKSMNKTTVPNTNKTVQTEVNRILKQNMNSMDLSESHIPFVSRFLKSLISEQEDAPVQPKENVSPASAEGKTPQDFTPETNQQDFQQSMEPSTDPSQFEVEGIPADVTTDTINSIRDWSSKLNEFAEFLNDPSTNSLHKILADGDRAGSLLRGVTRKASDSITRIAGEVEKLKEILNTYIITAPKKLRDTEQLKSGS